MEQFLFKVPRDVQNVDCRYFVFAKANILGASVMSKIDMMVVKKIKTKENV